MHCMSAQVEGLHRFTKLLYRMSKRSRHKSHPGNHGRCQAKTGARRKGLRSTVVLVIKKLPHISANYFTREWSKSFLFLRPQKWNLDLRWLCFGVYVSPKRIQLTCQHAHQGLKLFLNEPGTNQGKIGTRICDKKCQISLWSCTMVMSQIPGPCLILARKDWMASQAHMHPDIANMIAWTGHDRTRTWTLDSSTTNKTGPWTGKHHENGICCYSFANIQKMPTPTMHPGNCQGIPGSSSHYESWWPVLTVGTKFEVQGENQWLCWPQPCAWINLGSTWDHTYHLPAQSLIRNLAYKKRIEKAKIRLRQIWKPML